jgi:glycosyltransferase involved in cell wall biosynthesis
MISIVIPAFQRKDLVLQLLASIAGQQEASYEVIVVDDNSTDGTAAAIAMQHPQVSVLRETANQGPAACRNRGILAARGEIVVGFDSDVTLSDSFLLRDIAAAFTAAPAVHGIAFRILRPDGVNDDVERWWHPRPVASSATQLFPTDYFSGTAFAFRKSFLLESGLFPTVFFQYYEENYVAFRLLDHGGVLMYYPNLAVLHHAPAGRQSAARTFYQPRNQILLALHCFPFFRAAFFIVTRIGYQGLHTMIEGHPGNFFRALVSAIRLTPQALIDRHPLKRDTWRRIREIQQIPE